jgi:membrane protein DedA with SNARE-associated domain
MSDWVVRLIEQSGYLGVAFLMFLETLFPPIPSEVIMPVAGVSAAQGKLNFTLSVVSGTAGAMLGNIVWYLAARALGHDRMKPFVQRHGKWLTMNWKDVERVHDWFDDHGVTLVFLGRLVPTIRSIISIPAGLLDMRFRNFVIASTIGTALWTTILAGAGYKLQENFRDIGKIIGPASNIVLGALLLTYVYRLTTHKGEPDG